MDADIHQVKKIVVDKTRHDKENSVGPFECLTISVTSYEGKVERLQLYSREGDLPPMEIHNNVMVKWIGEGESD